MRIILGVCGSISAYKSIEVMRLLIKEGHVVRVVLTKGSEKFVRPELFSYLGAENVYRAQDDFQYPHEIHKSGESSVLHIELANWAEKFIIAPLSANTLSHLVQAKAVDLLSSVFLAYDQDKFLSVFPAMNTKMLNHPFVQENLANLKKLRTLKNTYVDTTSEGDLACGESGEGRLAEVEKIALIGAWGNLALKNEEILLTTGGTISPLDPVRFLANPSSGLTGLEIAKAAIHRGYKVTIIKGYQAVKELEYLGALDQVKVLTANTTKEMFQNVLSNIENATAFIASAAVADIEFPSSSEKIKKEHLREGALPFSAAQDILKSVIELKKKSLKLIGFAAETELTEEMLLAKWKRKPVDLLIGNTVHNGSNGQAPKGFQSQMGNYLIKEENTFTSKTMSKSELAKCLVNWIESCKS